LEYIAIDGAGNLYVIDSINRNLRKITPEGVVSTPEVFFGGEVAFDGAGNMYQRDYHSIQKISPSGLSSYLVRPPKYPVGHLETIMSYLPEGGAGFAVIAVALVNVMLLVMGIAFAANWVVQVVWKAALKTRPPAIFYSLAALAVSLLIAALGIFALPEFRNVYQQFGANWPTVTLIAVYLTERYLPLLLVIVMLVLLVVLRNKPRRERYFAVIFAGETALLFMIVGSLFWPLYKVGETMR